MSDLISRDAVLDTIHRFFTEEVDKIPTKKTDDGEVYVIHKCQPLFEMNKAICKRIKALPSAEKTGRCKDCKHFRVIPYHTDICIQHTGLCPKGDWYCADFEPQERSGEEYG